MLKSLKSPIAKSFVSVGFLQGLSMVLPLLTIPYLLKVLGEPGFALINVALAFVTFFVVFVDYGFNLLGTRLIALHKQNKSKLNEIFSNMLYAQLLLTILAIMVFLILLFSISSYSKNALVFISTFGIVLGATMLPTWFFQGFEKLNQLHLVQLITRGLYTLLVFVFVHNAKDVLLVPIFNSATAILSGLVGLIFIMHTYKLKFVKWHFKQIRLLLKEGFSLFVSALCTTSIQQLPLLVLAFFASPVVVAYYAFADKIMLAVRVSVQVFSSILFPKMVLAAKESINKLKNLAFKIRLNGGVFFMVFGLLLMSFPWLLQQYFPSYYNPSLTSIFTVWSVLPLAMLLKISYQQMLLACNKNKIFAHVMMWAAFTNIMLLAGLAYFLSEVGVALGVLLTEVFIIFALRQKTLAINSTQV